MRFAGQQNRVVRVLACLIQAKRDAFGVRYRALVKQEIDLHVPPRAPPEGEGSISTEQEEN